MVFKQSKEFVVHDPGEGLRFLRLLSGRDREERTIQMSSGPKINALVENFGLSGETGPVEGSHEQVFCPNSSNC